MIRNLFNKKILCVGLFILCLTNTNAQTENDTVANKNSVDTIISEKSKGASCGVTVETVYVKTKFVTDLTKAMVGEFAGVRVITKDGQPGIASDIRIRGINSINGSSAPFYVVDGIAYYGDITAINIEDIASLTVINDINKWLFYGTQASNGIINIFTKKGTAGKYPKINVDVSFGFNFAPQRYETITDPKQYTELGWLGLYTARIISGVSNTTAANFASNVLFSNSDYGVNPYYNPFDVEGKYLINPETGKMFDDVGYRYKPEKWSDYLLHTGKKVETNASISGGSEKITYYTAFGYVKDEGYYLKSDFQRINALANLDINPLKWLDINLKVAYNNSVLNNPCQGDYAENGFLFLNGMPPIYPVFIPNTKEYDFGDVNWRNFASGINPISALQTDKSKTVTDNLLLNNRIKIKLPFKLSIISDIGYNYFNSVLNKRTVIYHEYNFASNDIDTYLYHHLTARQMLKYDNTFVNRHNIDIFAGHEIINEIYSYLHTEEFPEGMNFKKEWYNSKQMRERVFAGVNYNFDERYFVEANMSYDKSPFFAKNKGWYGSWAVGGTWILSNENFMRSSKKWLKNFKIRLSYGVIGNDNLLYVNKNLTYLYYTKDLKPERRNIFNASIEMNIKKVLNFEIEFYDKKTSDSFYYMSFLGHLAFTNGSSLINRGVDLALSLNVVNRRNISLDLRANANYNFSKMVKLPTEYRFGEEREMIMLGGSIAKGHAIDEWYIPEYAGVDPKTGEALWYAYQNQNGDYINNVYSYLNEDNANGELIHKNETLTKITTNDYDKAGYNFTGKKTSPDVFGGFGVDFDCYGFNLSATFAYQIGGYGYDNIYANLMGDDDFGSFAWHKDMLNAWNPLTANYNTDVPRLTGGLLNNSYYVNAYSTRFLTSNSALQLANLTLGYNFPHKLIKPINRLNISVSCNNLLLASERKGYNPFTFYDSNSVYQYQQGRTVQMGVKVVF